MPSPVDKYYKQIRKENPSYSEEQAWATAWSVFCKHKDPGSSHCHKSPSEYLKGKSAATLLREFEYSILIRRVASKYAMSLPEDVESQLVSWRREKNQILESVADDLTGVDDLLDDFKDIERKVRDRDLRQLIRDDVQDADSLLKVVENLGELGVII
jgi:hypothetical protein